MRTEQEEDGSGRYLTHYVFCVENKPLCLHSASQSCPAVFCHSSMGHIVDLPLRRMWPLAALLVLSQFTSSLGIHMDSVGSHSMFTCESIGLRMCQDLPYNTTFMPNLLNHYDQQTAALAMEVTMLFLLSYTAGI
ncbi:frizzled-1-like [Sinocyclocheilus grahami]|uniref:frizzled-1-like n=1 Tax=Sinocyclocheilus grahami TaxID=75366 RepID=UPI0007ACF7C2|nr:PREDICTED: frizzled-1-like [Sinocyclocheilus grahami]